MKPPGLVLLDDEALFDVDAGDGLKLKPEANPAVLEAGAKDVGLGVGLKLKPPTAGFCDAAASPNENPPEDWEDTA